MTSLLPLLLPAAQAFCGTYLASSDASLVNERSQVVLARHGTRTTLTLSPDYTGEPTEFAMLIPVPAVLGEGDVRTVDAAHLDAVARFGAPRLVGYTCENLHGWDSGWGYSDKGGGCGGGCLFGGGDKDAAGGWGDSGGAGSGWDEEASNVAVESSFAVGAYEIVVLSAEEAGDLLGWLDFNGYAVSEDASDVLQDYLDQGVYFFAAKVSLEAAGEGAALPPLQFAYDADVMSLPMKLGQTFDADFDAAGQPSGWAVEHAWSPHWCDPCTGPTLDGGTLRELGYGGAGAMLTRIHVRTTPEGAQEDLTFYFSNDASPDQLKFIQYNRELESDFPICGQGWVTDAPGSCDDTVEARATAARIAQKRSSLPILPITLGLLGLGALVRRRRDRPTD
jgi:hypothetical protein